MRFALLGADADAVELVRAIAGSGDHQLTSIYDAAPHRAALEQLAPHAAWPLAAQGAWPLAAQEARPSDWVELLVARKSRRLQAVIVTRGEDDALREEQLRRLAQQAIPLLMVHPVCDAILGFELDMIRQDTGGVLFPYAPAWFHPLAAQWESISRSDLGELRQVVFERALAVQRPTLQVVSEFSRQSVFTQFTRDVAFIRRVLGDITKINAMGVSAERTDFANLSVQMTAAGETLARWSMTPSPRGIADGGSGERPAAGKVTAIGSLGAATLVLDENGQPCRIESTVLENSPLQLSKDAAIGPETAVQLFVAAVQGRRTADAQGGRIYDWSSACRDLELADAIDRSLQKGRTIELHLEEHSEESTFKGVMAAAGCGILLLTLAVIVISAIVGGFFLPDEPPELGEDMRPVQTESRWPVLLRIWPVYPIVLFLVLQFFRLVFHAPPKPPQPASSNERSTAIEKEEITEPS